MAQHALHVDARAPAGGPRAWQPGGRFARRSARGRLELHRRHRHPPGRRRRRAADRPHGIGPVHRPRRRQRRGSDGAGGAAAEGGGARRVADGGTRMDRARSAHVRAHRRHRQLLLHRPVVSEARRPRRWRVEHAPVPRVDRVLLGLRRLRRADHRAARLGRRRHRRRARPRGFPQGDDDASIRAGGRARLRVDDEPGLPRLAGDLRTSEPAPHRAAASAAAGARGPGRAAFRRDARDAQALRRVVRPLSVRAPHHRRSGVAEQRRRHGVSDAVHGGDALARADRHGRPRRRDDRTRPATSSGTGSSATTSSSTPGWTKGSTSSRRRGRCSSPTRPSTTPSGSSTASSRGSSEKRD